MYYLLGENNGVLVDENENTIHFGTEEEAIRWAEEKQLWSYQVMEGELRYYDVFHPQRRAESHEPEPHVGEAVGRQPLCPHCGRHRDEQPKGVEPSPPTWTPTNSPCDPSLGASCRV